MKHRPHNIETKEFSINALFLKVFSFLALVLLTVAGTLDPFFDKVDKWTQDSVNQVWILVGLCSIIVWYTLIKKR